MTIFPRLRATTSRVAARLVPSDTAWKGAATAVYLLGVTATAALFAVMFLRDFTWQKLPAYVVWVGILILLGAAVALAAALIMRIPSVYRYALAVTAPFVAATVFPGGPPWSLVAAAVLILCVSLIGGGLAALRQARTAKQGSAAATAAVAAGVVGILAGSYAIFGDKGPANPVLEEYRLEDRTLDLPNPAVPGNFTVRTLTYGSGMDRRRAEFGKDVDLKSRSVDGSKLIDNWDGLSGWLRSSYWGFDVTELPLQARVWYPAGDGPFPVVLVVHGNHAMEDFSDPGYAYLGELFASRGIIFASVDENFINSSLSALVEILDDRPGLKEENDARGWLLLQHLALWRDWNVEPGHPFYGKVDTDRFALIGHSRGGEAVGIAAAFNTLERYPDDASVEFDFGFNLRGVIAIAPVYGQYEPRERPTPIRDVNYFTIHGSMDGDVQSFEGIAQYSRVTFPGDDYHFRSALYVVGANHGQFNTTWGNTDTWPYDAWALNLGGIMDPEAQRDIARVYFSAFLEIVLNDRVEYLPIFRDARYAARWLPDTFYINQFADSQQTVIADFEEDIDPATLSMPGGRIATSNVSKWYETGNELKYDELDTHALVVAWDHRFSNETARIDFVLPAPLTAGSLSASISAIDIETLPDDWQEGRSGEDSDDAQADAGEVHALDWSIAVTDASGNVATVPLSEDSSLYPLIHAVPRRAAFLESDEPTEILFRRFEFPLGTFVAANPALDSTAITQISFIFDRSPEGAIIVDDLSFTKARKGPP